MTEAALWVRGTFPAELRRGAGHRQFYVEIRNSSARTYQGVRAYLSLTDPPGRRPHERPGTCRPRASR